MRKNLRKISALSTMLFTTPISQSNTYNQYLPETKKEIIKEKPYQTTLLIDRKVRFIINYKPTKLA